jgi:hypothetical protein
MSWEDYIAVVLMAWSLFESARTLYTWRASWASPDLMDRLAVESVSTRC